MGDEPYSQVTNIYNESMQAVFGDELDLHILPRLALDEEIISATKVRLAIKEKDDARLRTLLPETSYQYLQEHKII